MDEQYRRLANEIRLKSQQNLISWSPSNYQSTYETSLGKGAILIQYTDPEVVSNCTLPIYSLSFVNERGEIFHSIDVFQEDEYSQNYDLLKDIYQFAHNSYMKIDETLKSMFDDINSK